jgi:two-component system sensor histidine kinase VicK
MDIDSPLFQALFETPFPRIILEDYNDDFQIIAANSAFRHFTPSFNSLPKKAALSTLQEAAFQKTTYWNIALQLAQQSRQKDQTVSSEAFKFDSSESAGGQAQWWRAEVTPVKPTEAITYLMVSFYDVTQAHTQEKQALEQFRYLVEQAPIPVCLLQGQEFIIEIANQKMLEVLGKDESVIGKPSREAMPEMQGQPYFQILEDMFVSGVPFYGYEAEAVIEKNGILVKKYFNYAYQPIRNLSGKITAIMTVANEVTDQVRIKQESIKNEKRFRDLLDALPTIAWTNNPDGEVTYYNQRWFNYTGFNFEDTKAWGWKVVVHPDDLQFNLERYTEILSTQKEGEFEIREKGIDGKYRWHLVRLSPMLNDAGEIALWVGTATDIESLKALQQQKDEFLSVASHELKTPMTTLNATLQVMSRMLKSQQGSPMPALVNKADKSMRRISHLVNELLVLSRINAGELYLNKNSFILAQLLNSCCDHIRLEGKYRIEMSGNIDLLVYADEYKIEQVIVNLVNNAVKYAPYSETVFISIVKDGNTAIVSVTDYGPGIAQERQPFLFNRYYRADPQSFNHSGLGIGLYIAAMIIAKHGGEMGVESQLGHGSTFWFTLPLEEHVNSYATTA